MKKIIAIVLAVAMAACITACGDDDNNTSSTASPASSQVTSTVSSSEPEPVSIDTPEPVSSDAPVSSPAASDDSSSDEGQKEWEASDFTVYGISDFEKPDLGGELTYYTSTELGGITAMWSGVTDMDTITNYGKLFFAKTAENGGNYDAVFNPDALKWQVNNKHETFESACTAWTYEYYYADWYYEKDGVLYMAAYYGENDQLSLKVYRYS